MKLRLSLALGLALALGAPGCAVFAPELPADFPNDLTPYPDAKLTAVESLAEGALSASWETPDELEAVSRFYREDLKARGWNPVREKRQRDSDAKKKPHGAQPAGAFSEPVEPPGPPEPDQRLIVARKGVRSATFMLSRAGDTSQIDLIVIQDDPK
jgi:hypothetical protein